MFKSNSKLFDFQGKTLAALPPADPLPMLLLVEGEMHQETALLHQVPLLNLGLGEIWLQREALVLKEWNWAVGGNPIPVVLKSVFSL